MTAKKIVFVTSGQPSLNPRLIKEADALADAGYEVTVLYAYWNDWATAFDEKLLPTKKWRAIRIGGHPQHAPFTYFLSRLLHKIAKIGIRLSGPQYFATSAIARCGFFLPRAAKKHKADMYIGHNLGALAAVVKAAKKQQVKSGFDAEDFHRNEVTNDTGSSQYIISKYIEDKYLPFTNYITASSPLIADEYRKLYPGKSPATILNVFPKSEMANPPHKSENGSIKLFWFSQTVGNGRGLSIVSGALKLLKDHPFELHLLGRCDSSFKDSFDAGDCPVYFHEPVNPANIVEFATQFDIGIASEKKEPFNRDICLTNKIFSYMQAGLAIVASNTTAQQAFLNRYPAIGQVYEQDNIDALITVLQYYQQNRDKLNEARAVSLQLAHEKFCWEQESVTFLETVQETIES